MAAEPVLPPQTVAFQGDLDVFSIRGQWEALLLPAGCAGIEVDLASVGDLDLSGLQLLCALRRDAAARGMTVAVRGAKEEWRDRFAPMGLGGLFEEDRP